MITNDVQARDKETTQNQTLTQKKPKPNEIHRALIWPK